MFVLQTMREQLRDDDTIEDGDVSLFHIELPVAPRDEDMPGVDADVTGRRRGGRKRDRNRSTTPAPTLTSDVDDGIVRDDESDYDDGVFDDYAYDSVEAVDDDVNDVTGGGRRQRLCVCDDGQPRSE